MIELVGAAVGRSQWCTAAIRSARLGQSSPESEVRMAAPTPVTRKPVPVAAAAAKPVAAPPVAAPPQAGAATPKATTATAAKAPATTKAGLPKLPKMPKGARKAKPPKPCECGCTGMTNGGRFIAGHDGRLKGLALRVERKVMDLDAVEKFAGKGTRDAVEKLIAAGGSTLKSIPEGVLTGETAEDEAEEGTEDTGDDAQA